MSEFEYLQLAGHITEKLDNTSEYEDWIIIQEYIDELQSNLTKEQLAYINLRDTFNKLQQENQQLKADLKDSIAERNRLLDEIHKIGVEIGKDDFIIQEARSGKCD